VHKIVVLNTKGGSGKSTLSTTLAAYYAIQGRSPSLMDFDPQGSSMRWVRKRPKDVPGVHGIAAYENKPGITRTFALRTPAGCERVILDTPAAVIKHRLPELTRGADSILVPVLPSDIDIHATARCIADLLLIAKIRRADHRLAVVANRVKRHTRAFQALLRFLTSLQIPVVGVLSDSQNYVRAAEAGLGIHELKASQARDDVATWVSVIGWLESREVPRLSSLTPTAAESPGAACLAAD
jgi:chromosome partitioning protein